MEASLARRAALLCSAAPDLIGGIARSVIAHAQNLARTRDLVNNSGEKRAFCAVCGLPRAVTAFGCWSLACA